MHSTAIDKANILLVDDNIISSIVFEKLLRAKGYNVYYAEDGYEALNLFQTKNIDLCLLDIAMPEMEGFTLGKIIRAANAQIPILLKSRIYICSIKDISHLSFQPLRKERFVYFYYCLKKWGEYISQIAKNSLRLFYCSVRPTTCCNSESR